MYNSQIFPCFLCSFNHDKMYILLTKKELWKRTRTAVITLHK